MRLATHEVEVVQQVVNVEAEEEIIAVLPSERRLRAGVVMGCFPRREAHRPGHDGA